MVVGCAGSCPFRIQDMVFQGTVLGPQLWNFFFADAANAIQEFMYKEVIFADDFNAYKVVAGSTTLEGAMDLRGDAFWPGVAISSSNSACAVRCPVVSPHGSRVA